MARTQKLGSYNLQIINILLSSVDGKIASHSHESTTERRTLKFTNNDDFKHMQKLTASCDAVLIGAKTLNTEAGAFRVSHLRKDRKEPHWFVLTKTGNINFEHPFWKQKDIPKSAFHIDVSSRGLTAGSSVSCSQGNLNEFINFLIEKKFKKIALLGGGELNGFFWEQNLISELYLTISPTVIGAQNAPQLIKSNHILHTRLSLKDIHQKKNFLFLHYKVIKNEKNK